MPTNKATLTVSLQKLIFTANVHYVGHRAAIWLMSLMIVFQMSNLLYTEIYLGLHFV